MYAVIYVIGVFQPKQIKTCAIVCRPFEILCEAAENLTCARKLFLYNLLCMTHHIIFVNSVWENYKSGVDFAPGRHFGESQPKKLKSLFSRNKQRSRKFKHFTTASEIKSYWEHPQKHVNVRLSAAKMRFTQSKVRMLHALCSASNLRAREKRRKTSVQADSQGHVLPACRRLLFPLLHAEKGRLRNAVANRVPASRWVPKILGTRCDRLTHSAHCLT